MSTAPDLPSAFSRLHRNLQEPLYRMKWTSLRPIQVEAIHEIFDKADDLILAARTASGKTEAAFLPILSRIVQDPTGGVRAIYAGPLKALINDQFLRLERLCEIAEIPVHKWHGDVGPGPKRRLLDNPSGVLLITPESIESLFVNHPHDLPRIFERLAFVVIDEMHAFLGTERGAHLKSLIERLARKSREPVRKIGLSATLGDPLAARKWLRPRDPDHAHVIEDHEGKSIRLRLSGYLVPTEMEDEIEDVQVAEDVNETMELDVFEAFAARTALIFGNSKRQIERSADVAKRECARRGLPDRFRVHHGSLSKTEREETEDALRSDQATATFCSNTLEMGIDVGNVQAVGQIGAPWSVASLAQRLGRSGRREGESSEMRIYVTENEPAAETPLVNRLFLELLQATAMTELVLQKWSEPPEVDHFHLSTLVQQILSVIAEQGGEKADRLFEVLCAQGGFANVDAPTFIEILRSMGAADLIEQAPDDLLVLGLMGEKIVRRYDFYTSFVVTVEYRVTHHGRPIGSIGRPTGAPGGDYLILAGRRWKVLQIDDERREILVEPSEGGKAPAFLGRSIIEIHPRIREVMRELLLVRQDVPAYLDSGAAAMLQAARKTADEAGLTRSLFLTEGCDVTWFPWTGTCIVRTLTLLGGAAAKLSVSDDRSDFSLVFRKTTESAVRAAYLRLLEKCPTAEELVADSKILPREKYDPYLSDSLRAQAFAREALDVEGALDMIRAQFLDHRQSLGAPNPTSISNRDAAIAESAKEPINE
jgi:ATP-dependent helicase Lhr and Lhr-like helicase